MEKIWKVDEPINQEVKDKFTNINPVILQLLMNRELDTQEKIDQFLNPDYERDIYDPFLFPDMEKAVDRILTAIENKESIIVYGDYDADGVTSSAVMMETLIALGAKVDIYIPDREKEGYGMNAVAVTKIADDGAKLVITVDCGISNKDQVDILNEKNVDVIITDHHHGPKELPDALAIINPNTDDDPYPFKGLTGCGVAFKVIQGLIQRQAKYKVNQLEEGFAKWLLDLVAIGTVADIQPLLSENRTLVKYGLVVINKSKRIGLKNLIATLGNKNNTIDERVIGWQISPRLNAAGRLNSASTAYKILITKDANKAQKLSEELNQTNIKRQQLTEKIKKQVEDKISVTTDQKLLYAVGDDWPTGLVGLVAGRMTDRFNKPTLVISHYNGEIIGSARSIPNFNVVEAIESCSEHLEKFGGHPQAAGFTIKDEKHLEQFLAKMSALAEESLDEQSIVPVIAIDTAVDLKDITWEFYSELEKFSPFGQSNPKPLFLAQGLTVVEAKKLGKDEKHMRLTISEEDNKVYKTIGFGFGYWCDKLQSGDKVDMVFEVDINEWNGNRELQFKIIDIRDTLDAPQM